MSTASAFAAAAAALRNNSAVAGVGSGARGVGWAGWAGAGVGVAGAGRSGGGMSPVTLAMGSLSVITRCASALWSSSARLNAFKKKTARSAVVLADSLADSVILVFTSRGIVANYASALRPERAPIFAFTPDAEVCRSLAVSRGVSGFVMEFSSDPDCTIEDALAVLREKKLVEAGQPVVILSDVLTSDPAVDAILLRKA